MRTSKEKFFYLITLIVVLFINSVFLFSYYNFYLTDKISNDIREAKNINHENIYQISKNLYNKNLTDSIIEIKDYVKNNGGYASLKTMNGDILYTNKKDINKLFSSTVIILIDSDEYELTYSKITITPGIKLIRNFMIYEIIIVTFIILVTYIISSSRLIDPIEIIIKDIKNYRYGIRPKKRKMPDNFMQIQNSFVDMVDTLEIEKEYQNQIIASISHDIKTPLTSIIGYTERLKNNNLSKDKKEEYLNKIYDKSLLMKDILEEFDDYQSCNIKDTMKFEELKVKELLDKIKIDFEDDLKDKKIKLNIKCNCNNKKIYIDYVKIRRVFGNIINNSITHFNKKDGIINISVKYDNNDVIFEIADNAGGIENEKDLKKIFEPLYTTDPSRKISGLGLSICKQIISAHDGTIYAKNNKINGLSIIFEVPVYKS